MDDECINEKIRKYKDNPLMLYWDQRHKGIHPDDSSHYSTEYDSDDDDEDHDAFIISLKRDSKQSPVKLSKIAPIKTKEPLNKIDNMKHEESESEKSGKNLKGNAAWNDFAFSRGSINNHKNTQFPFKQMFGRSGSSSSSSSSCTSIPSELPLESQESQQVCFLYLFIIFVQG